MTDIAEISSRTAIEIGLAYRSGIADPVALTRYLLDRIEQARGDNIFISVTAERGLREAEASRERYRHGHVLSALDGVPLAWKDLIDVAEAPTTAGSLLFDRDRAKTADQACVANAAAAGMVCLGKLNMTELAYSGLGLNPHFGTPVNPNDRSTHRSPGGSSSGSGAAIAAGLVPCAIGTDTGGSVRIPASFNGVVGFKTSEGRIDKTGVIPLSRTLDTLGPLARSVADCAMLDMVLRGAVSVEATRRQIGALRLLIPTNIVFDQGEPQVIANFERSVEALERAGARPVRRRVDALEEAADLAARHGSLTAADAYHQYCDRIESADVHNMDRRVVHRIMQGKTMSAHDLLCLQYGRQGAIARLDRELEDALLVMPTTPITAPQIAPLEADDTLFHKVNLLTLRNTMLGNFLDLCGLAIPNGHDENGLPTSILFSGRHGEDVRLLGLGLEIERIVRAAAKPCRAGA